MLQVFFQLTDKNGVTHESNVKPYEFDEATVYALLNCKEISYPLVTNIDESGRLIEGKMATIEHTIFDLINGVPVLRIKLLEVKSTINKTSIGYNL